MYPTPPSPYGYGYPPPPPPTPEQMRMTMVAEIRRLRSDLTSSFNPYSLNKILDSTLALFEYMLAGAVIHPNPNQVPGQPVNPLDSGKTKVEFFGGPQTVTPVAMPGYGPPGPILPGMIPQGMPGFVPPPFAPPAAPVTNGDVQFVPSPPAASVEFYGGPPGTPGATPVGYERNGQKVEFFPNPPGTPVTGQPAAPSPNTFNNPPTSQIMPGAPAMTVEAGNPVPPSYAPPPAAGLPVAPPFASVMPPPSASPAPVARPPQTREELLAMLPVPPTS